MPAYEYVCPRGHRHEEVRRVSDRDEPSECQTCALEAKRDVSRGTSFRLCGGGWAASGYSG